MYLFMRLNITVYRGNYTHTPESKVYSAVLCFFSYFEKYSALESRILIVEEMDCQA